MAKTKMSILFSILTHKISNKEFERKRGRKKSERYIYIYIYIYIYRERERERERQTDRQTDRQRQIDRRRQTDRNKEVFPFSLLSLSRLLTLSSAILASLFSFLSSCHKLFLYTPLSLSLPP